MWGWERRAKECGRIVDECILDRRTMVGCGEKNLGEMDWGEASALSVATMQPTAAACENDDGETRGFCGSGEKLEKVSK